MVHFNINIKGRVQGVYFRATTVKAAEKLNLNGIVKNESDGSVSIEVEGTKEQIEPFLKWCYQGPPLAKIKEVKITQSPVINYESFRII